ncbi:protein kinase [Candidatus Dependentiae bacterium]|nr:protein kinase [Candidatus Dependentiae bacterium]
MKKLLNIFQKTFLILFLNVSFAFGLTYERIKEIKKIEETDFYTLYQNIVNELDFETFDMESEGEEDSEPEFIKNLREEYQSKTKTAVEKVPKKVNETRNISDLSDKEIKNFIPYKYSKEDLKKVIDVIRTIDYIENETDYKIDRVIGRGTGKVVFNSESNEAIILFLKSATRAKELKKEIKLSKELEHKNIVGIKDYNEEHFFIIQELAKSDFLNFIKKSGYIEDRKIMALFRDIACGLSFMHENGYIHRDLKFENVLIFEDEKGDLTAKITDVSYAKKISEGKSKVSCGWKGSIFYSDPKTLRKAAEYSYLHPKEKNLTSCCLKDDIYSFGMMLYLYFHDCDLQSHFEDKYKKSIIAFGKIVPETGFSNFYSWLIFYLSEGSRPPFLDRDVPEYINGLIQICWQKSRKKRPTAKTLYKEINRLLKFI